MNETNEQAHINEEFLYAEIRQLISRSNCIILDMYSADRGSWRRGIKMNFSKSWPNDRILSSKRPSFSNARMMAFPGMTIDP